MKIHFTELELAGYARHGNWWTKNDISVNPDCKIVKHVSYPIFNLYAENVDIDVADIDQLGQALAKFTKPNKKQSVSFEVDDNWR